MLTYLLDTNILIDLATQKNSASFFEKIIQSKATTLVTSIICVAEFLTKSSREEEKFLKKFIESGELEVIGFQFMQEALKAGELRKKLGLRLPDAIVLMTCENRSTTLLTHDKEFFQKAKSVVKSIDPFS
ncbi:MAG: PIN domain-containing protein [Deltaproteobacteria bacterium]|nr:MAG: PIN domain-containing protein [Deltaproteobacteria bacterium]